MNDKHDNSAIDKLARWQVGSSCRHNRNSTRFCGGGIISSQTCKTASRMKDVRQFAKDRCISTTIGMSILLDLLHQANMIGSTKRLSAVTYNVSSLNSVHRKAILVNSNHRNIIRNIIMSNSNHINREPLNIIINGASVVIITKL